MSLSSPVVSVCIANYNGEALLLDCIGSVLNQDTGVRIEIIVHDDASTDASLALLQSHYPQVQVIPSKVNVGFCIANNRMADIARGDYLLLLNNDAALFPDAISTLLEEAMRLVAPRILSLPQHDWISGELIDYGYLLDPLYVPIPNRDPTPREIAFVIGACLFVPRALWNELGGFPDWFGSISEDVFLGSAARLRGVPSHCLNASGYRHRQGASFGGNRIDNQRLRTRYQRRYLSERNRLAVLVACTPTALVWPWLGVHVMGLILEALVVCVISRTATPWRKIYWPALRDSAARRSSILALRRRTQAKRRVSLTSYFQVFSCKPQKLALFWRHGSPKLHE